jgi:hypothetical protein
MQDLFSTHFRIIARAISEGRVVPLLGAGVNLSGRPADAVWQPEQYRYLPSGAELAAYLASHFDYPTQEASEVRDLLRVSEYVVVMTGLGPLYERLHELFDGDFPPSSLHRLLARLPVSLRQHGTPYQLIVTTNYDDTLERAFRAEDEEFDLVSYVADGDDRGKFLHTRPDGNVELIESPNDYGELSLERRTVILKIHGAVNRVDRDRDSFVISEDHYIDYLTHTDLSNLVPATLAAKLRRSHFLFLGYSMRDWNLRVILHRIWGEQKLGYNSWAIQLRPEPLEQRFWDRRGVMILEMELDLYVADLAGRLGIPISNGEGA